jgi:hypothetical protein
VRVKAGRSYKEGESSGQVWTSLDTGHENRHKKSKTCKKQQKTCDNDMDKEDACSKASEVLKPMDILTGS